MTRRETLLSLMSALLAAPSSAAAGGSEPTLLQHAKMMQESPSAPALASS
jgi:hypothetical protein